MRSGLVTIIAAACWVFAASAQADGLPGPWPFPWATPLKQSSSSVPRSCPRIYLPVCALTKTQQLETFYNRCAVQAGAIVLHQGTCFGLHCPRDIINGGVCAKSAVSGAIGWYDNICWTEKNWATFLHYGTPQSCAP
jgi:hypothetical protein